jgi:hypothetical protein
MRQRASLADRLRAAVSVNDEGCWEWQLGRDLSGYGKVWVSGEPGRREHVAMAHRASYETFVGPIPDGLQIDHLCRNRACVNPDHLEPVTALVNSRRRSAAYSGATLCPRGHSQTPLSTVYILGRRQCRTCTGRLQ